MWYGPEEPYPAVFSDDSYLASPQLRVDDSLWHDALQKMQQVGVNMVVIDLGDGVEYESHPEISVENAWSIERLKKELKKIRGMGIEPIPKMNFSTCHDRWLGQYRRMVSTPQYYAVCKDLIEEAISIFDTPRFMHLGMDEESWEVQKNHCYALIRQGDLWWHDFLFFVEQVENNGVRPWIWSDSLWHHPDMFFKKMPKSVVQSNWYYDDKFDKDIPAIQSFFDLAEHGYDQIPCGSIWAFERNLPEMVKYLDRNIDQCHVLGYLETIWRPTIEKQRPRLMKAMEMIAEAKKVKQTA